MDRRFAAALACSLALHILLIASLRTGKGSAPGIRQGNPLLVYLQPPIAPSGHHEAGRAAPSVPSGPAAPTDALPSGNGHYLLPGEVDVRAQPVSIPMLIYPEKAQQLRISGVVRLKVYIGRSGKIDAVDVVASEPQGLFEEAALEALLKTTYKPARKSGLAVPSQKLIEVRFDPYENISLH